MHDTFSLFKRVSGLSLAPKKCILILGSVCANATNIHLVQEWLRINIPDWKLFEISNVGNYLGFHLGPLGGSCVWQGALKKFHNRVDNISQVHENCYTSIRHYNSKALPTLGYIAQLVRPPSNFNKLERSALHRILHIATNSLSLSSMHHLKEVINLDIHPMGIYMQANMLRAAHSTCSNVEQLFCALRESAFEYLPLSIVCSGSFSPPGWDSPAYVCNLFNCLRLRHVPSDAHTSMNNAISKWLQRPKFSLQAQFSSILRAHLPVDWHALVARRLHALCPGFNGNVHYALANLEPRLKLLDGTCSIAVIKTLCNSWCTSHRYHETVTHTCIFGCGSRHPAWPADIFPDNLQHYLVCPILWMIIRDATGSSIAPSALSRLGVTMDWHDLRLLAVAHHIYHYLKLGSSSLGTIVYYRDAAAVIELAFEAAKVANVEIMLQ